MPPLLQHLQHLEIVSQCTVLLLIPAGMPLKSLTVMAHIVDLTFENLTRFAEGVDTVKLGFVKPLDEGRWETSEVEEGEDSGVEERGDCEVKDGGGP